MKEGETLHGGRTVGVLHGEGNSYSSWGSKRGGKVLEMSRGLKTMEVKQQQFVAGQQSTRNQAKSSSEIDLQSLENLMLEAAHCFMFC